MPNLKKLNSNLRAANKKKPTQTENQKRDTATLEVLRSINENVAALADKEVPAPVVNIPERKPFSYQVKDITRNRQGGMTGMRIDPIINEPLKSRKA